jgi:hypothetical protein
MTGVDLFDAANYMGHGGRRVFVFIELVPQALGDSIEEEVDQNGLGGARRSRNARGDGTHSSVKMGRILIWFHPKRKEAGRKIAFDECGKEGL